MKNAILLSLVFGLAAATGLAQTSIPATEVPVNEISDSGGRASARLEGDLLAEYDMETLTGDVRLLGVENIGGDWFMTGARDYTGCYMYQTDGDATTVKQMVATGHKQWGWRDLAWDGTWLWASDSYDLEQIDPATLTATGVKITQTALSPCHALAYNATTGTFFTASFTSDIYEIDMTGQTVNTYPNGGLSHFGAACDDKRQVIWWWSQDGSGSLASEMEADTGVLTGKAFDGGSGTWPGSAGGACIFEDPVDGRILGGMQQTIPDNVCKYSIEPDPLPDLDLEVNGMDAGVITSNVNNVTITYDLEARQSTGVDADVWLVLGTPFGFFSYDAAGPVSGWNAGLGNALHSGPLTDLKGTALDAPLPVGSYMAHFALDTKMNGKLNPGALFGHDLCDITVILFSGFTEDFDDGIANGWISDGPEWFCTNNVYYLDCSSFRDWVSYYDVFEYRDFTYTADMRMVVTTSTTSTYDRGLLFRSDGTINNCYEANMDNDGTTSFYVHVASSGGASLYSATSPNMVTGAGSWNTMSVDVRGTNFGVFINGVLDYSVVDAQLSTGKVCLMGGGSGIYDLEYEFDNVVLTL